MAFGLQKGEIESLVRVAVEESEKKYHIGEGLKEKGTLQVTLAITEVITQNNARILEALTEAGIQLKLD
jgi:hypothetical protein